MEAAQAVIDATNHAAAQANLDKDGGLNAAAAILPVAKSIESQLVVEGQSPEA